MPNSNLVHATLVVGLILATVGCATALGPGGSPPPEGRVRKELSLEQDRGGVMVNVRSVSLIPLESMPDDFKEGANGFDYWDDAKTVGILDIKVTNQTDSNVNVHPAQATVVVGDEQVKTHVWLSEVVGGELYPEVMMEGIVIFGLRRHAADEVPRLRYVIDAPFGEDFEPLADSDFDFEIELQED